MRKIKLFSNRKFKIFVITFVLIVPIASHFINYNLQEIKLHKINNIRKITFTQPMDLLSLVDYDVQVEETKKVKEESKTELFIVTSYDLSIQSCGKSKSHKAYGISRGGISLRGKTINSRYIAVDPKVIPLGSKVKIEFIDGKYKKLSNYYIAIDTGDAIKGKRIDLFMGENKYNECKTFGKTEAYVEIIKEDN